MERVLKLAERWVLEIDAADTFSIERDASASPPLTLAKAELRDKASAVKQKALKALGWKISDGSWTKSALAAGALYLTSGLAAAALLSRGVLMSFEGTKSWTIASDRDGLRCPAVEFALAIQRVAPDVKTIIVKRRVAGLGL